VFSSSGSSLTGQMRQNESQLGSLTSHTPYGKINEINGYRNQGIANSGQSQVMREGYQMQAVVSVQPPSWYKLS